MQNAQDDYLFVANFVDCDERERWEDDLSRTLDATRSPEVRECFQRAEALDHRLRHPSRRLRAAFCNVVEDPLRDRPRRPLSSGRASAAIAPIHPSGHVIVLDQPAFTRGGPALFHLGTEPLVVVHRAGQQVERHLVDSAARLRGQTRQLRFEFGRNLQVHKVSVGCADNRVNRRLSRRRARPAPAGEGHGAATRRAQVLDLDDLSFDEFWRLGPVGLKDACRCHPEHPLPLAGPRRRPRSIAYAITGVAGRYGYLQRVAVHPPGLWSGWVLVADGIAWVWKHGGDRVTPHQLANDTVRLCATPLVRLRHHPRGPVRPRAVPLIRRVLVTLVVVVSSAVGGVAPGPSAGAQTAAPLFALAAQSPWVAPDGTFLMSFQAGERAAGVLRVVLTVHDPLESRTVFDESVTGGGLPPSRNLTPFAFDAFLPTDASGHRILLYPT